MIDSWIIGKLEKLLRSSQLKSLKLIITEFIENRGYAELSCREKQKFNPTVLPLIEFEKNYRLQNEFGFQHSTKIYQQWYNNGGEYVRDTIDDRK